MNETAEDLRLEVAALGDWLKKIVEELKGLNQTLRDMEVLTAKPPMYVRDDMKIVEQLAALNEKFHDYFTIQVSEEVEKGKR